MNFWLSIAFTDCTQWTRLAKAADELGYAGISMSDHVLTPQVINSSYPYAPGGKIFWDPETHWPDNWVAAGAMGAVTSRLKFMTNVYILPLRNVFTVAKAVGTAAFLTDNRLIFGIGVGWMKEEFDVLGEDFATRGKRTDEMIEVLRKLWKGGMVEHHGRFYNFGPLQMSPAPTKPVPIYIGGETDAAVHRAAKLGDGWMSAGARSWEEIEGRVKQFQKLRHDYGKDKEPFAVRILPPMPHTGETYKRLQQLGLNNAIAAPWNVYAGAPITADEKIEAMKRYAADVIHKYR